MTALLRAAIATAAVGLWILAWTLAQGIGAAVGAGAVEWIQH